jgi:hypothetical protein
MTRSRQKNKELAHLRLFRRLFQDFDLGPACVTERPDFLVNHGGHIIGIEIAELFKSKRPASKRLHSPAELEGIQQRIVRDAKR